LGTIKGGWWRERSTDTESKSSCGGCVGIVVALKRRPPEPNKQTNGLSSPNENAKERAATGGDTHPYHPQSTCG
jgi:hypothetical protein